MTATSTIADVAAFIARCFGVDIGEMGRDATQLIISVLRMANVMIEIDYGMQGGMIAKAFSVFGHPVANPRDAVGCCASAKRSAMIVNGNSPNSVCPSFFSKNMVKVTIAVTKNPVNDKRGLNVIVGEKEGDSGMPSLFQGLGSFEGQVKKILAALPANRRIIVALDNTFVFNAREIKRVVMEKIEASVSSVAFVFAKSSAYLDVYMDYRNRVPTERNNELEFASL